MSPSQHNSDMPKNNKFDFAGMLAKIFSQSKLTPVIAIVSIFLGVIAVIFTPKEEEPQISVPMIDISTQAPGFTAHEIERKVTEPIERAMWGLEGVEYIYSTSQPSGSLVTIRFKVGEDMETSLVKIHHKLLGIRSELPVQTLPSDVKSFSIYDVPFLVLTFSSSALTDYELRTQVAPLARQLSSTPDLGRITLLGGQKRAIRVIADGTRMKNHGVSLLSIANALKQNDSLSPAGKNTGSDEIFDIEAGGRLKSALDVESIAIGQRAGGVVHIKDVAKVIDGPEELTHSSVIVSQSNSLKSEKAVSIVFAKRKGTNAVSLSKELLERVKEFQKKLNPDIHMTVVRDYGATAGEKSNELIEHLILATLSVSILIALVMGFRAALVVAIAIPVTLALTLAIYYFLGYTLNRVTLFALIFSIGILVDDAIVVVENMERHLHDAKNKTKDIYKLTLDAVKEIGNPTILATFTVIAAILPMAFVRGLMGPYMKPIPVGASFAMILSLLVAFIITPWAAIRILNKKSHHPEASSADKNNHDASHSKVSKLDQIYKKTMTKLLKNTKASLMFGAVTMTLFAISCALVYFKLVKVKMLPFDNKQEFQVLIDYPAQTPLSKSLELSKALAISIGQQEPDVKDVQIFAGEAAPFSFSGMVKHTFLRNADYQNDFQIVLKEKSERKKSSHQIIEELRPLILKFALENQAISKVLEIPPGPPVLSTVVAEVYGPDEESRTQVTKEIQKIFNEEPSVVDLDTSLRPGRSRLQYLYNQQKGGLLGTQASEAMQLGRLLFSETPMTTISDVSSAEEVSVDLSVDRETTLSKNPFQKLTMPSMVAGSVSSDQVLDISPSLETNYLFRKNLMPVSYVMSELSGAEEAPVYGILKLAKKIKYPLQTAEAPRNTINPSVKWDGEWFITYEVFRDMGGAFAVVMVLIYILVLGWFKSFKIPLVIMAPIPISLIGILPGHFLMGSYFTATSMIGFIAGAGIIVRNSIILVDFIEHQMEHGLNVK
ncbi:MAG: efflux RND transporter permease subunit, partial [Bdellovibrionales bacterium]